MRLDWAVMACAKVCGEVGTLPVSISPVVSLAIAVFSARLFPPKE